MRKEKALINLLRGMADLLAEESARNPDFAAKLESLLSELPGKNVPVKKRVTQRPSENLPDIYTEWNTRDKAEFRLWLCDQTADTLRALVRKHDLDATRRTTKWKDPEKLSTYIADQLRLRLARGSSFLRGGSTRAVEPEVPKADSEEQKVIEMGNGDPAK